VRVELGPVQLDQLGELAFGGSDWVQGCSTTISE
jgi:hypothetical protein